jgi:hypothetical protein
MPSGDADVNHGGEKEKEIRPQMTQICADEEIKECSEPVFLS